MENTEMSPKSEEKQLNRVSKIRVSIPLLNNLLPAGSEVVGVKTDDYFETIELIVYHPEFEPLKQGDLIPIRPLSIYRESCEKGHTWVSRTEYGAA